MGVRNTWASRAARVAVTMLTLTMVHFAIATEAQAATATGAVISNGTVMLGVRATGDLNYNCAGAGDTGCPAASAGDNTDVVGIRYVPNNTDAIAPGCQCEGWGVADVGSGLAGGSNQSFGGPFNLTEVSFVATATTAVSVVDIADAAILGASMRVTHDYHPSTRSPNLYEVTVTVENTGTVAFTDLRYRRVMDWDVEPTAFDEWVTILNPGNSPQLVFDSDDGFADPSPLAGPSYIESESVCGPGYLGVCTFTDLGSGGTFPTVTAPSDHGSLFDFSFGATAPGTTVRFTVLYGAAGSTAEATAALSAAGAEVYSLGEPNCPESGSTSTVGGCGTLAPTAGVTTGVPNTFMFGFITTSADISLTKTDTPDPVTVGQNLTYTITVENAGPNAAAGVQVTDALPAGVTLVSATPSAGTCAGTTTVICDLGVIENNATATVTIVVTPTAEGMLSNTASVATSSADANPDNNVSTVQTLVVAVVPTVPTTTTTVPVTTTTTTPTTVAPTTVAPTVPTTVPLGGVLPPTGAAHEGRQGLIAALLLVSGFTFTALARSRRRQV